MNDEVLSVGGKLDVWFMKFNPLLLYFYWSKSRIIQDFPGDPVVKNLPANAGNTGSIPGLGRSHMPWGN